MAARRQEAGTLEFYFIPAGVIMPVNR